MAIPTLVTNIVPQTVAPETGSKKVFVERSCDVTFENVFDPADGRHKTCTVKSVIPTLADRTLMTSRQCALTGGATWSALTESDRSYYVMLATVSVQLRDIPAWLMTIMQEDVAVLSEAYDACVEHTTRYLRGIGAPGHRAEEIARFRLSTTLPPADNPESDAPDTP